MALPRPRGLVVGCQGRGRRETFVVRAVAGIVRRMARALPHLLPTAGLLVLSLGAAAVLACNSDDTFDLGVPDLTTGEVDPTEVPTFTTGAPDDTSSTGDEPPSKDTCRDGISCVINCALDLPMNPDPEQDYSCFTGCLEELNTEELYILVKLIECVSGYCVDEGRCSNEPGVDNSDCQPCLITSLAAENPPVSGCETQAMTCK